MARYADAVDISSVGAIVDTNYLNKIALTNTAAVSVRNLETDQGGTTVGWVRAKTFQDNPEGQAIGVGGEITLENTSQTKYQVPKYWRADGALFDDIYGEITPKVQEAATLNVTNAVTTHIAQMSDSALVSTLQGVGAFLAGQAENYLDTSSGQLALKDFVEAESLRGDAVADGLKICVTNSKMFYHLKSLAAVATNSNTLGMTLQNQVVASGRIEELMGYVFYKADKLPLVSSSYYYMYLVDPGSIIMGTPMMPEIDPFQRAEKAFQDILKFKVGMSSGFEGVSWSATKTDVVTNTALATAANWSKATEDYKHIPMIVIKAAAPTFA
jgi:hypothetical protein